MPRRVADGRDQVQVANVASELANELGEVGALLGEARDPAEAAGDVAAATSPAISKSCAESTSPSNPSTSASVTVAAGERSELLEGGDRVAHSARRVARDERQRGVGDVEALAVGDDAQAAGDVVDADAAEVEALAARLDGLGHLVRMRRGEHEDDVARRLLERLEQRVERRRREHVHLVDDVDLVAPSVGAKITRPMISSRTLSTPVRDAASSSMAKGTLTSEG